MAVSKKVATISAIASVVIAISIASMKINAKTEKTVVMEEKPFELHLVNSVNKLLSSKANYDYGVDKVDNPDTCKVIHTETIQRHGARHLNKLKKMDETVEYFSQLLKDGALKDDTLVKWATELREKEEGNTDKICKTGEAEIRGIAQRMRERLGLDEDMSGDIVVENTFKKRTQETRDVFLKNLLPSSFPQDSLHFVEANKCEDIFDAEGNVNQTVFHNYAPIRFFSVCPNYATFRNDSNLRNLVEGSFDYNPYIESVKGHNRIWDKVLSSTNSIEYPQKRELLFHMFTMCQFEASCYNTYNHTCAVLEREPNIFQQLSMDDDMRLVMYKGEGSQLNFQMACPLGRSMLSGLLSSLLNHLPEGEKKEALKAKYAAHFDVEEEVPRAHLRFGHAESILPLYYLFIMKPPRLQNNRMRFSGVDFIPMSANFQFDLLQCGDEFYFRLLANEVPIHLDLPRTKYMEIFELEPFLDQWLDVLKEWEITDCSYDDFVKLCDKPVCKA